MYWKNQPPDSFFGRGTWCGCNSGLGKAGSNPRPSALVILNEQMQPLPILRSDTVEEEDGYLVGYAAED